MPKVDIINYGTKNSTIAFLFSLSMVSKSTIAENISVFEDLSCQLRLLKENSQFNNFFTIW